ncbi:MULTISPECIES: non-ribosomal peptide synthetase [unclassified Dyella]|uniref:non-ribosomal peptide synthetase n=1 Tax=unclassified Dyella TaxID=2634549 RepID=UPI000C83AD9B|nr:MULTISPECIES: non-ribosomal peptide synthetase [unclassified Dyella]MDR3445562.1 non-ribosomal peptide synthetase [Dyella sp.]PMQ05211.1 Tyrocidine synthase 3 [Dyella sp. AD56]
MNPHESAQATDASPIAVDYDPFAGAALARVVPATAPQREVWLASTLEPEASLAYNESVSLRLHGDLSVEALQTALRQLPERHEALRATFASDGGELCIAAELDLPCPLRELSWLGPDEQQAEIEATLARVVSEPFNLDTGPLVRAEVLRLSSQEHLLVFTAHHIVCDGWSFGVIVRDLAALYAQQIGKGEELPPADVFADYALAEADHTQSAAGKDDEAYWLARFANATPSLDLPTDHPRPRQRSFHSRREDLSLDASLVADIKRMGAQRGASLYATLLAGFGLLLQRLSGQDDVVIGIPSAGQAAGGHQDLVGHCVNVLPLRVMLDTAAPFEDSLKQVRSDMLDAFDHQQYTLGSLLARLALPRDPSRLPLAGVLFNLDQALDERTVSFPGLSFEFAGNPRAFENFELFVNAAQLPNGIRLECQYNSDLFEPATIQAWLDAYATLLRHATAAPQAAGSALGLASPSALAALTALQPSRTAYPAERLAHEYVEQQADRVPTRIAIAGDAPLSYAELDARANRIARVLRGRGVQRGQLVGLSLSRSADMIAALLAVLKSGAGYVPLDPGFPAERLAFMTQDASLAALIVDDEASAIFEFPAANVLSLKRDAALIDAASVERLPRDEGSATPESAAYVIYTSGSTGKPKGVRVPHRATSNFISSMQREPGIREDDRLVAVTTLSFDIAFLELMLPLSVGAAIVLADHDHVRDGSALRELVERSGATIMQATPAGWRVLLESGWAGHAGFKAIAGGEPLPLDLAEALLARCGELWNAYGPTETTVWSTLWRAHDPRTGITIGQPIANTTVHVLDEHGAPCPLGMPGEIYIGGDGVTLGYLDRPELNAERFLPDPFSGEADARMYRTGDRGRWLAKGELEHLGRLDFQVKIRGYRIELGEIETALADLPEVARAVVMAREDRPGDVRLVAYVVAAEGADLETVDLCPPLRQRLPDYMVPQHFVAMPAIPLLPNGKIDRKWLPAPTHPTAEARRDRLMPRTDTERRVATAMEAVLALPELDVRDNFFALGGHSLLAAQLTARLNREFGIALSFRTLFDAPTIEGLAQTIDGYRAPDTATPSADIPRLANRDVAPLSSMQQRLWYLEQLHPGRVVYNTPSAHRLRGPMNVTAFRQALRDVVQRQPALRTSIETGENGGLQRIHAGLLPELLLEDLSALPAEARLDVLKQTLDADIAQPFDLAQPPLYRARLFRLDDNDHVFFFMAHHIVWDGWSFDLLYEDLSRAYVSRCAGDGASLPPLPIEYADFSAWHRDWMRTDTVQKQLAHWLKTLDGALEPLELPTDRQRPARMSGAGATEWVRIPAERAAAVHALAQREEATSFMVLLATYYVLLHRLSGQRDLIVGTPVRGRDRVETESIMGLFVNALPLRVAVDPEAPFRDVLKQVRQVVLDAFAHPDVPFEQLVFSLGLARDESRPPISQAMFSFQDARRRIVSWGELSHEHLPVFQRGAADDIGLWFLEQEQGLLGGITYNADIFDPATAARFRDCYESLLASALADPSQTVARLDLLPEHESALLAEWNQTSLSIPNARLHQLFELQCDKAPERAAIRCRDVTLSYRELDARANRIAHALRERGAAHGALVGVSLTRSLDMLATVLAVLKTGAGYVPLDPDFPADRLSYMAQDARLAVLVTESAIAARIDDNGGARLLLDEAAAEIASRPDTRLPTNATLDGESVAYVIYTSGSTGRPKGVAIPHRAVVNFLAGMAQRPGLHADERLLAVTTLSFDIAVLELFGPLSVGGEVLLATREESMDGDALCQLLDAHAATIMQATPVTWHLLLQTPWQPAAGFHALCGGEPLSGDLAQQLLARGAELWNMYGPTETTVWSTCWRVEQPERGISIGTPIANTTIHVLDEYGQHCPIGVPGELCIGGEGVALGYLHREELTAERFPADPFAPGKHFYRTGDRARWLANGTLEHLGRLDFQVKLRGYRIEPGEIEAVARMEPSVLDCVVVAREIAPNDERLVLYAVCTEDEELVWPKLRAQLAARLPAYMQPQHLVRLSALPRTPNGKTDRKALPPPVLNTTLTIDDAEPGVSASDDPRERYLGEVWCKLVGADDVRASDNFFDIGGHSLLAIEMVTLVRKETGVKLNLLDVATSPLASLAAALPEGDLTEPQKSASLGGRLRQLFGRR